MARQSMILDMLKTPQQVREEQLNKLRERSLAQANLLQPVRGTTALPGLITGFAQQQAAQIPVDINQAFRRGTQGLGAVVGGDTGRAIGQMAITGEERRAGRVQEAVQGLQMGNIESMKDTLKKMQDAGAPLEATLALSERIAKREKELLDRAAAARGEQLQRDLFGLKEREIELDEAKFAAEQLLGGTLGDFDLNTEEGLNNAVETLMRQGKVAEAVRLKNAYKKEQDTLQKRLEYLANTFTNGDMDKAYEMYLETKRTDPMIGTTAKRLDSDYDKAILSRQNIMTSNDALKLIDEGRVILGSFAQTRKGAEKFVSQVFGIGDKEAVSRTEQLMSKVRTLSAQMLASGMFGSGTGISERDLLEAKEIAGAAESLTPEGMAKILRMNAKMEELKLKQYNERIDRLDNSFWERVPYDKDAYKVEAPELYTTPFTIDRAERAATNDEGVTIYEFQGKWYNADGTEYVQ
jgi:hypothetical protein